MQRLFSTQRDQDWTNTPWIKQQIRYDAKGALHPTNSIKVLWISRANIRVVLQYKIIISCIVTQRAMVIVVEQPRLLKSFEKIIAYTNTDIFVLTLIDQKISMKHNIKHNIFLYMNIIR